MILLNYKNNFLKYIIYMSCVFLVLLVVVNLMNVNEIKNEEDAVSSSIVYNDDNNDINVIYPRFNNDDINNIITSYIYTYVKKFRLNSGSNKVLNIRYDLYYFNDYVNVVFNIDNSLSNIKYKNILLDLKNEKLAYISNLYEKDYLINEINSLINLKYSSDIYDKIKNSNVDNHTYIINDNKIDVYFNDIDFGTLSYIPMVSIIGDNNSETVSKDDNLDNSDKKFIAFTFDDGPSKYTSELIDTLELNNSSATFFMLGNRMKYNTDIVKKVYDSNSEIGTHTYSHKRLTSLSNDEIYNEINSSEIIFNDITGDHLKYLRPPYGSYNDHIKGLGYNIILWNIDPKDWLTRDSKKIYNSVLNNACDGCIVLMHDIYPETIEAVKMLIPTLNEMNYEVVSISNLIYNKNHILSKDEVISHVK